MKKRKHHGNYRRKHGKRSGRKPDWYVALIFQRNFIQKVLDKWDARK